MKTTKTKIRHLTLERETLRLLRANAAAGVAIYSHPPPCVPSSPPATCPPA
jgi:hypothetical protein